MKPNPNLDELLSSFMDGELSPRQRTEVQRMAAHDPAVARRLRQLQNCRTLFCSLPPAEAPGEMLEQVKQALERKTLLLEQPVSRRRSAGVVHLMFRKLVAAAAMLALLGGLGAVVYQIVAPVPGTPPMAVRPSPAQPVPEPGGPAPVMTVADAGFSGHLELQTRSLLPTDAVVKWAIDTSGLTNLAQSEVAMDRRIYRVVGTRNDINHLMASLRDVWQRFDSATLHLDPPAGPAVPVTIEAVTPEQIAGVVARNSAQASLETARAYAAMNHMTRNMPGSEILPVLHENSNSLMAMEFIPKPKYTGPVDTPKMTHGSPSEGTAQVSLTIVLLRNAK